MRIITEDNIDQLTNMSYSDNISKILGKNITDTMLSKANKNIIKQSKAVQKQKKPKLKLKIAGKDEPAASEHS